ncbi:MAG TPA: DUF2334 domain-containing protein [Deltaproteobacteria bacterium]|mgnify:CR=1 FL=1|nr:DUF2334 domain-containing protein [Deltaproteobacteria bacterium]HQI02281.1 DUF2334 domain-containing protein [Deltaproteobacteria bacterium]HQJ09756.1 DUF2334 domain-containing protein [Deltaproteobacteria bacterium]
MARYLFRFDDICPTMNWITWQEIESLLVQYGISPILSVVPDNRDRTLALMPPVPDFWDRVRRWQDRGWSIALHGYQHTYVNRNRGMMGLTPQSEFAGLPREVQREKLLKGIEIFAREGIRPDCWVAPSHSFDGTTVDLLAEAGIHIISDGLWFWPHMDRRGMTWVPQQLWERVRTTPPGIWTVCYHPNEWSAHDIDRFREDLSRSSSMAIRLHDAVAIGKKRRMTITDRFQAHAMLALKRPVGRTLFRFIKPLIRI